MKISDLKSAFDSLHAKVHDLIAALVDAKAHAIANPPGLTADEQAMVDAIVQAANDDVAAITSALA
jgi:hypothetical protein